MCSVEIVNVLKKISRFLDLPGISYALKFKAFLPHMPSKLSKFPQDFAVDKRMPCLFQEVPLIKDNPAF